MNAMANPPMSTGTTCIPPATSERGIMARVKTNGINGRNASTSRMTHVAIFLEKPSFV